MLSHLFNSERQSGAAKNPLDLHCYNANIFLFKCLGPSMRSLAGYFSNPTDSFFNSFYSMAMELKSALAHCFARLPHQSGIPFELNFQTIADVQEWNAVLPVLKLQDPPQKVDRMLAPGINVCCFTVQPENPMHIYLPDKLLEI